MAGKLESSELVRRSRRRLVDGCDGRDKCEGLGVEKGKGSSGGIGEGRYHLTLGQFQRESKRFELLLLWLRYLVLEAGLSES